MPFILDLPLENLSGEELDFVVGEERGVVMVGGENGSGDLPRSIGVLELNQPLIGSDTVAGLRVVVEDVDSLSNLDLQLHLFQKVGCDCIEHF